MVSRVIFFPFFLFFLKIHYYNCSSIPIFVKNCRLVSYKILMLNVTNDCHLNKSFNI